MTAIVFLTTLRVLLRAVLVLGELWEGSLRGPARVMGRLERLEERTVWEADDAAGPDGNILP